MKRFLILLAASFVLFACAKEEKAPFCVTDLKVDYMSTPLGIDATAPRFSWVMQSDGYAQRQTACRITVTEAASGMLVYDSDNCVSDVSVGVVYRGEPLSIKPVSNQEDADCTTPSALVTSTVQS